MRAGDAVVGEVAAWQGVTQAAHPLGGVELRYGSRELGHVDGASVDLPFARGLRDMLVQTERAESHPGKPGSLRVTLRLREPGDEGAAIELFRLAYERARVAERVRAARRARLATGPSSRDP